MTVSESPSDLIDTPLERCLIVAFRAKLALSFLSPLPDKGFEFGGEEFRDLGYGDFSGFYDWLRTTEDVVIGVRYWSHAEAAYLVNLLSQFSYVDRDPRGVFCEVYFCSRRDADLQRSTDQDLIYDKVFLSAAGTYAVAFEISDVTDAQIKRLRIEAEADWLIASETSSDSNGSLSHPVKS